jgi:threonine synthase
MRRVERYNGNRAGDCGREGVIGRDGIGCEPASATTVAGIRKLGIKENESVVAVLTGHVLKDTDYVIKYHNQSLTDPDGATG